MPRSPLAAILAALALLACAPARALTTSQPPKVHVYTAYDADFLYLAARVEDPFVIGTHSETMSEAWSDDAVGFYLDLPHLRRDYPHPRCHRLIVSAAGGFMASEGTLEGTWRPATEWMAGLKLDTTVQGTLNAPGDLDQGFVVEVAIPWRFLGGLAPDRARIGFNAVCFVRGENEAVVSWSPNVKSDADLDRPSTWGDLLVRRGGTPQEATAGEVTCPLLTQRLLVDGNLSAGEWIGASVLELVKPEPRPVAAAVGKAKRAGLLCALYRCDYQADPRLGPAVGPAGPGTAGDLVNQPMGGIGPWMCADRADWHRSELAGLAEAGLDVILPMVAAAPSGRAEPRGGLSALARALQDTRGKGAPTPLVGLYLDLSAAAPEEGGAVDARRAAAGVIEFFRTMPQEFWVQLEPEQGPGPGRQRLAVLGPGGGAAQSDLLAEISRAFVSEFPGDRLVWIADVGWRDKGLEGVTAYCTLGGAGTLELETNDDYPVAVISPGYDDGESLTVTDRLGAARYETAWTKALGLAPRLIILRSWNDFGNATQVAPSRQYGVRYVDVTRRFVAEWEAQQPGRLRLLRETLPAALRPGTEYKVDLLLRNASFDSLSTGRTVSAGYRIEDEGGRVVAHVRSAYGLRLHARETRTVALPLATRDENEAPLLEGRYRVVFEVLSSKVPLFSSHWFEKTVAEVAVWVTVGRVPARHMTVLEASLPARMETGGAYPIRLRLRNDGSSKWSASSLEVAGTWYKGPTSPGLAPEAVGEGVRLSLSRTVSPGQVVNLRGTLPAAADGRPLPPGAYEVRWDLVAQDDRATSRGRPPEQGAMVEVVARDAGVRFVKSDLPAALDAGSTTPVKVVLTNAGLQPWESSATRITYQWAYWDGAPTGERNVETPLDESVAPGDSAVATVPVRAPAAGGAYWLWWDAVLADGSAASAADEAGGGNLMPSPVIVRGGRCVTVDLASQTNLTVAAPGTRRAVGNLDGHGNSLPSEHVPPDVGPVEVQAYPSGYYAAAAEAASPPEREVAFSYPRPEQGRLDGVACRGQTIQLPEGRALRLHLLGAGTEADVSAEFTVAYDDGSSAGLPLTMSDWRGDPLHGESIALGVRSFRSLQATRRGPAHLYRYVLPLDAGKTATALTLPDDRRMVIVAVTAEMAGE